MCPHSAAEEASLEFGAHYTVSGIVHRGQVIRNERGSLAREISFRRSYGYISKASFALFQLKVLVSGFSCPGCSPRINCNLKKNI